jgi:hypothetical protein
MKIAIAKNTVTPIFVGAEILKDII